MEGAWHEGELLGFDLETTGVDRYGDVPVSFALVRVAGGTVVERVARVVNPGREIPAEAAAIHGITNERALAEGIPLNEAVAEIATALLEATWRGVPVAGMRLDFDLTIMDTQCRRVTGRGLTELGWSGPALDASVIDRRLDRFRPGRRTLVDLCAHYGVPLGNAHDASADAEASIGVLRALCDRYPRLGQVDVTWLHRRQVDWHHDWAVSYSDWRMRNAMTPLEPDELAWPIASGGGVPPASAVA
jgi:DNA polymerase-3 subunit epsilon